MKLEDELYELLKKHFPDYDILRKPRLKGYSGFVWEEYSLKFIEDPSGLREWLEGKY
jgi:hypothetical protein